MPADIANEICGLGEANYRLSIYDSMEQTLLIRLYSCNLIVAA